MSRLFIDNDKKIDVSKLKVEQTFKNYNEMCKYLGLESGLTGTQKQAQQKELSRFFEYERVGTGQKIIVTDIYDTPLEKNDRRKLGNNSIYVKYIELILMCFLSKQPNYTYTLTKRGWWELLGMVNHKYSRTPPENLKKINKIITSYEINSFYQRCNKKLEKILLDALRNLHNRKLIIYEPQTIISEKYKGKEKYHVASDDEKKKILKAERWVLKHELGFDNIFQIYVRGRQNEYFSRVNEILQETYGWHRYFKQIKLIYNQDQLQEAVPDTVAEIKKNALNSKIIDALDANAIKSYENQQQKYIDATAQRWNENTEGKAPVIDDIWQPPSSYIEAQRLLTKELVMIGHTENEKKIDYLSQEFIDGMKEYEDIFMFLE